VSEWPTVFMTWMRHGRHQTRTERSYCRDFVSLQVEYRSHGRLELIERTHLEGGIRLLSGVYARVDYIYVIRGKLEVLPAFGPLCVRSLVWCLFERVNDSSGPSFRSPAAFSEAMRFYPMSRRALVQLERKMYAMVRCRTIAVWGPSI
jgi:hypothetical protein